jgi:general secretion pathway protein K
MIRTARRVGRKRQLGAAILTAMLIVVLVASLATTVLWQQWRDVEVEAAQRSRTQSAWILTGAQDWARLILREDARKGGADHLAEPWAVPLEEARLSTFLAADRSDALAANEAQEAFLSGRIVDLQSRLNVTNLVQNGKIDEPSETAFVRLFELLGVPQSELAALTDGLTRAEAVGADSGQQSLAPDPAGAPVPLLPQDVDQLTWLGLSNVSIALLRPFVTILPVRTPVNLNTAPVEVVYAVVDTLELADAHRLINARSAKHLANLGEAAKATGNAQALFNATQHSVSSRYFEIQGKLQVEQTTVQEYSVVQRDGLDVKTLWRRRGVQQAAASLQ